MAARPAPRDFLFVFTSLEGDPDMKRFKLFAVLALIAVPLTGLSLGCEGEVDGDGAHLEVGE